MSDLRFYNEAFTGYAGKKRIRRDMMESVALVGIDGLVWRELWISLAKCGGKKRNLPCV